MADATQVTAAFITPECRRNRGEQAAWIEATDRLHKEYLAVLDGWKNAPAQPTLNLILTIERPEDLDANNEHTRDHWVLRAGHGHSVGAVEMNLDRHELEAKTETLREVRAERDEYKQALDGQGRVLDSLAAERDRAREELEEAENLIRRLLTTKIGTFKFDFVVEDGQAFLAREESE